MRSPVCRDSLGLHVTRGQGLEPLSLGWLVPASCGWAYGLGKGQGHGPHLNIPFVRVFLLTPALISADELGGWFVHQILECQCKGRSGACAHQGSPVHMPFLV